MPDYPSGYLKILITSLVIALAAGILIFSAALPLVRKIRVTQQEIQKTKDRYAEISGKIEKLREIENRLAAIDSEIPDVKNLFLVREEAVSLVESMETAVSQAGLSGKLSIVDQEEDARSSSLKQPLLVKNLIALEEVPYVLRFGGSYRQVVDLLQYLENLPYFTIISALSASAQLNTSQTGKTGGEVRTGNVSGEINGVLFLRTNEKNEQD